MSKYQIFARNKFNELQKTHRIQRKRFTLSSNNKKVWLITGSSTGFGRALAEAVLKHGVSEAPAKQDRLIATARKPEQLNDFVNQYPETVKAVRLDVTNKTAVKAAVDAALEAFGRIDVLVNNVWLRFDWCVRRSQ